MKRIKTETLIRELSRRKAESMKLSPGEVLCGFLIVLASTEVETSRGTSHAIAGDTVNFTCRPPLHLKIVVTGGIF